MLREDDPDVAILLAQGWTTVAESWGARLAVGQDVAALEQAADAVSACGWRTVQLDAGDARRIVDLDAACADDYPRTPVTPHEVPDVDELAARLESGWWAFGAVRVDDRRRLDCVSVLSPRDDQVETMFTVTRAPVRGRGLATAVKARSILELTQRGYRDFGTGGAAADEASLRANLRLGYVLEPRWLSLRAPQGPVAP